MIREIFFKIEEKLRVCLCVLFGGMLTSFIGSILPQSWWFSILIGFGGGVAIVIGFISLVIYWIQWADK